MKGGRQLAIILILAGVSAAARAEDVAAPPPSEPVVALAPAGLSVHANEVALEELLIEISRRAGIAVVSDARLDERVSVRVENAPVAQVLQRILRRRSYVIAYAKPWAGAIVDSPNRLWILSDEPGSSRLPDGDADAAAMEEASRARGDVIALVDEAMDSAAGDANGLVAELSAIILGAEEADVREEAVYALGELDSPQGVAVLHQALGDSSATVRAAAAASLGVSADPRAEDGLMQALNDGDAGVREAAVSALAELGNPSRDAKVALRRALSDSDVGVRQAAADVLDQWN